MTGEAPELLPYFDRVSKAATHPEGGYFDRLSKAASQMATPALVDWEAQGVPNYASTKSTGFWSGVANVLGFFSDTQTRLIGQQLYPDDPKYSFGPSGSPGLLGFSNLFADAGIDAPTGALNEATSLAGGSTIGHFPFAAIAAGTALEFVNPLDLWNKVRFFAPTRLGKVAKLMDNPRFKNVLKNVEGRWVVDQTAMEAVVAAAKERILKSGLPNRELKNARSTIKNAERLRKDKKQVEDALRQIVAAGMDPAELSLKGKSIYQQAREGYRRAIGFTGPASRDHIPFMGAGEMAMDDVVGSLTTLGLGSKALRGGGIPGAGRVLDVGAGAAISALGAGVRGAKNVVANIADKFGWAPKRIGQAADEFEKIIREEAGNTDVYTTEWRDRVLSRITRMQKDLGIPDQVMPEVFGTAGLKAAFQQIELAGSVRRWGELANQPDSGVEAADLIRAISDAHAERAAAKPLRMKGGLFAARDLDFGMEPLPKGATDEQRSWLIPGQLTDDEAWDGAALYERSEVGKKAYGEFDRVHDGRFVVLGSSDRSIMDSAHGVLLKIKSPEKIIGLQGMKFVAPHTKLKTKGGIKKAGNSSAVLVARRLQGGQPIAVSRETGAGIPFEPVHLQNLEMMAAQLADQGYALVGLQADDFLINSAGGIQLVNPLRIVPVDRPTLAQAERFRKVGKKADAAMTAAKKMAAASASEGALRIFSNLVSEIHDPGRVYKSLRSPSSVAAAAKLGRKAAVAKRGSMAPTGALAEGQKVGFVTPSELLDAQVNHLHHKMYAAAGPDNQGAIVRLLGFPLANSVEGKRAQIRAAQMAGGIPEIPPVQISKDRAGNIHINEGQDWALAAALEGVETIPITAAQFSGQALDTAGTVTRPLSRFSEYFIESTDELAASNVGDIYTDYGLIAQSYKLHGAAGLEHPKVPSGTERLTQEQFDDVYGLAAGINKLLAQGAAGHSQDLAETIRDHLLHHRDGAYVAAARAADAVMQSKSWEEFASRFSEIAGTDLLSHLTKKPQIRNFLDKTFLDTVRPAGLLFTERLAKQGVFSEAALSEPRLLAQYGGIVEAYDFNQGVYRVIGANSTLEDLRTFAKQRIETTGPGAEHMRGDQLIEIVARDGQQSFRVDSFVAPELIQKAKLRDIGQLRFTEEQLLELEQKRRILVNPTKEVAMRNGMDEFGRWAIRSVDKSGYVSYQRNPIGLFVTEGGDVLMGLKAEHEAPEAFLTDMFGAGFIPPGEFGWIDFEKVVLNYPVIGTMQKLDRGTIASLQGRLRYIAKKLIETGINPRTPMHVNVPFDKGHWRTMFGTPSLASVAAPRWKLNIQKNLVNIPLDVSMDTVQWAVRYHRPRGHTPAMDKLINWIIDENLEADRNELLESITKGSFSGYMHRQITEDANNAIAKWMNRIGQKAAGIGDKKEVKQLSAFLKKKSITDLTTIEMNAFMKVLRETKSYTKDQVLERLASQSALAYMKREMVSAIVDEGTMAELGRIAQAMNDIELPLDSPFWIEDPLVALGSRVMQSQREIKVKRIMDRMADHPSLAAVLTRADLNDIESGRASVDALRKQSDKIDLELRAAQARLSDIKSGREPTAHHDGTYKTLEEVEIPRLEEELGKLQAQIDAKNTELGAKYGLGYTLGPVKRGRVYVDSAVAERMLADGTLNEADFASRVDLGEITALRAESVLDKLGKEERLLIFSEEVAPIAEKYFGVTRDPEQLRGFLRGYDTVMATWKQWTLFPIIAYHSRNILSSFFQYWLGNGRHESIGTALEIMNLVSKGRGGRYEEVREALDAYTVLDDFGNVTTGTQLYHEWIKNGGPQGFHVSEFGRLSVPKQRWKEWVKRVTAQNPDIIPSTEAAGPIYLDNPILRPGKRFAEWTENRFRLAYFIDEWRRTGNFEQAAIGMKKVFYDYEDLNAFERQVARRAVPFYSFSRHNIPRMLETIVLRPEQHLRFQRLVSSFQAGITDGMPVEEDISGWMSDRFNVVVGKANDGSYWLRSLEYTIPAYELYALFSKPGQVLVGGLTPALKIPIEALSGKQFFGARQNMLGVDVLRDLKTFDNEPASSALLSAMGFTRAPEMSGGKLGPLNILANEYLFGQVFRLGKNMSRTIDWFLETENNKRFPGVVAAGLDMLFGRAYNIDPVRARMYFMRDYKATLGKINGLIRMHQERGNVDAVKVLNNMRANLALQFAGDN